MFCVIYSVIYMQNTCWHQQLLTWHSSKKTVPKKSSHYVTLDVACWTWSRTSAHMFSSWATSDDRERLWLLWEEAGTRERCNPSTKCRAWRVLLGNSQLEDERVLYHLVPFSKVLGVYAGCWEALLCLAVSEAIPELFWLLLLWRLCGQSTYFLARLKFSQAM